MDAALGKLYAPASALSGIGDIRDHGERADCLADLPAAHPVHHEPGLTAGVADPEPEARKQPIEILGPPRSWRVECLDGALRKTDRRHGRGLRCVLGYRMGTRVV